MRVWITRSQPGADRQADELRGHGFEVLVAPVIAIEPVAAPPPAGPFSHVLFLSEQAVRHCTFVHALENARLYAVGRATARALAARALVAEVPEDASSEGLLELLDTPSLAGARVLIVAGEGGRKTLRDALTGLGARVTEHLCYRRLPAPVGPETLAGVSAVLVASQDGFRLVARLWFDSGGRGDLLVITASERIADLAAELGFSNVRVANGAASEDWIAALTDQ